MRNNDYIYVDKTALIYQLVNTNKIYFPESSPSFRKSLLVSTLRKPIFWERKNFSTDWTWSQLERLDSVSVLHVDFSGSKYVEAESLRHLSMFSCYFGKTSAMDVRKTKAHLVYVWYHPPRLWQTGQQVVVIVDKITALWTLTITMSCSMRFVLSCATSSLIKSRVNIFIFSDGHQQIPPDEHFSANLTIFRTIQA